MAEFDFTSRLERAGNDAYALDAIGRGHGAPERPDEGFDAIPMWVADMNFPTAPSVQRALAARIEHPAYGYFLVRDEYMDAIRFWHATRHGVDVAREAIGYENGVLGGVVSALCACGTPGDAVLVHSPTYIGFTGALRNAGFRIVTSPLVRDRHGTWRMDYADMERTLAEQGIRLAIFCSPHNPCGRVWERAEIERSMAIYEQAGCTVVSDEIWSDIVFSGQVHVPTQTVGAYAREHTVALYAPSKTFNLAGLVGSYHVIYGDELRERVLRSSRASHYNDMNVLSMHALMGAYCAEGARWVDALVSVLEGNVAWACDFIERNFDGIDVARPQGTYMLFLDCTRWCERRGMGLDELLRAGWRVGVGWQDGRPFHGSCHIRVNVALPFARVQEAFGRLAQHVFDAC